MTGSRRNLWLVSVLVCTGVFSAGCSGFGNNPLSQNSALTDAIPSASASAAPSTSASPAPAPGIGTGLNININSTDMSCAKLTGQSDCEQRIQAAIKAWQNDPRVQAQFNEWLKKQINLTNCHWVNEPAPPSTPTSHGDWPNGFDFKIGPNDDSKTPETTKNNPSPSLPPLRLVCDHK